ncbi:hypothetical protein HCN44_007342 [Aphidius gifuensis]|uniref:Uncharacterized protein n=2 Tax=Aphidius gifuensis TaxID=684658 RepID=A0A834XP00_APHGI|nr:hypothetical protein HCN44_007342 [Aphidius gifuensis]
MNKLECLVIPNYQHSIHENQPCIFESVTKSIKTFRFRCASGETLPNNFATEFARFNNLNILTLENWKIDNDIVELLEIKKDTLTHLSLAGSTFNDSKSSIGKLINLEYLNVGCTLKSLTNENLINIINNCCKLKYINISWCKDITKPTFMYLKNLKNLNDMLLSNVGIDDDIIKQFKNLKTLECAGSTLITDKSIRHILKNSPTLERLVIGGTNVTTDTIHYAIEIKKLYKDNKLTIILNGSVIQQYIENNSCRRIHCEAYQVTDNLIVSKDFFEIMYLFMRCRFTPVQEIE